MEYDQFTSPFGTVDDPRSCYFLDIELPSNVAILEVINMVSIPWEELHRG
jgi:hypothetical protein